MDTDLNLDSDAGVLKPAAVVGDRSISTGGSGPMATLGQDGTSLSFSRPTSPTKPEIYGDTATYQDALTGEVLREHDPASAHSVARTR